MRKNPIKNIESHRVTLGPMRSDKSCGVNGAFIIIRKCCCLRIIASDGTGWEESGLSGQPWEHVSVSLSMRSPTWEEMDYVKSIFWRNDETVMQLHVPTDQHVNEHEYCLHLWRPIGQDIPRPPQECVGRKHS